MAKHVLIINNGYPSPNEPNIYIFVHRQALALRKHGYRITVLDIDLRSIRWMRKFGFYWDSYEGINILRVSFPFVTVRLARLGKFLNEKIGILSFRIIENKLGKIDIVHSHFGMYSGNAGAAIRKKYDVPFFITEHSSKILNKNKTALEICTASYTKANKVIAVSNILASVIEEQLKIKCVIIPNVVDTTIFTPRINASEREFFHFLSVGSMNMGKRFDLTIEAFSKVHKEYPKTRLTIVGSGLLKNKMEELSKQLDLEPFVVFIDHVPNNQMADVYRESDCFVLASDFETFGMVYAEAISCGIPAVATDNGGSRDIITPNTGIIVKTNSVEELYKAMGYIINNRSNYDPNTLHNSIEMFFSENAISAKIDKTYRQYLYPHAFPWEV